MIKTKNIFKNFLTYFILILLSIFILLPFALMFLGSFREHVNIIINGALALPESWDIANFKEVLIEYNFRYYFVNTIIVTAPTVILANIFAVMSAYALAFMDFPFKKTIKLFTTVVGIMIATPFIMIPLYQLMARLNLIDSYLAPILPQVAMSACFATMVLRSFFKGLPKELIEASLVDGATSWQVLWKILVPIAKPAIITSAALTTVWTWNAYLLPLILLQDPAKVTLPVGLMFFKGRYTTNIPLMLTGTTITSVPMIIFYLLFQRHLVKGLSQGVLD
jgi:raffinose/stachyose/melibiose transport system permease protein